MTTLDKATETLRTLATYSSPASLADLAGQIGMPKPTLYRVLKDLTARGMVQQDDDGAYALGYRTFDLARQSLRSFGVTDEVRGIIVDLAQSVDLSVHLSGFRGGQLVYLDSIEVESLFLTRSMIGTLRPLYASATGRCVLANLDEASARQILEDSERTQLTPRTVTNVDEIMAGFPAIRATGFAINDEEDELASVSVATHFEGPDGAPLGGISIVAPSYEYSAQDLVDRAPELVRAGKSISATFASV